MSAKNNRPSMFLLGLLLASTEGDEDRVSRLFLANSYRARAITLGTEVKNARRNLMKDLRYLEGLGVITFNEHWVIVINRAALFDINDEWREKFRAWREEHNVREWEST